MRQIVRFPLLAAGGILLTGAVAAVAAVSIGRNSIRASAFAATEAGADAYGRSVEVYLAGAMDDVRGLAQRSEMGRSWGEPDRLVGPNDALDKRAVLRAQLEGVGTFEYIALAHPGGHVYLVEPASAQAGLSRPDVGYMAWFRSISVGGPPVVSDLYVSTITRHPTVTVAVKVVDPAGRERGTVFAGLRLPGLSALGGTPTGDYFGYLTDADGLVVAHGRNPRYALEQTDFSSVPAVRLALAGGTGVIENTNPIEREDRISGYRRLDSLGWAVVYVLPSRVAFEPATQLTVTVALVTLLLVVAFGATAAIAARRATQPLARLAIAATAVAAGDRTVQLPPAGDDEVGRLAREFGSMVAALERRETDLLLRAAELESANREMEAFVYTVAHDLRTPVRAIDGFGAMLATRLSDGDGAALRQLAVIRRSAARMGELIDGLLEFARLGRQVPDIRDIDPGEVALAAYQDVSEVRDPAIEFTIAPDLPRCRADRLLLTRLFENLLSNAVKFTRRTHQPSRIDVGWRAGPDQDAYFVRDNGIGLDPAFSEEIFGVFRRLNHEEEYEGTGVGLAIVHRVVELHGGRIWVESMPAKGTTILFTLEGAAP